MTWGQVRVVIFTLQAYGKDNEMRPASKKRVKTTPFLQDYGRLTDM